MLPKFLIADNSQEAPDLVYVVHTEKPQCIIQCDMDGFYSNQKIYWILSWKKRKNFSKPN